MPSLLFSINFPWTTFGPGLVAVRSKKGKQKGHKNVFASLSEFKLSKQISKSSPTQDWENVPKKEVQQKERKLGTKTKFYRKQVNITTRKLTNIGLKVSTI